MTLTLPFDPNESVPAARLAWAIERYAEGELTREQIESTHEFDPGYGPDSHLRRFRSFRRPIQEVLSYNTDEARPSAVVRCDGALAEVRLRLGAAPEYRVLMMSLMKLPVPGVITRPATDADGPALADLERRCAVEAGGVLTYYDRGDDYFAQQRLMDRHTSSIAEYDGRIVGVSSDAIRWLRICGADYHATYRFHLRVDPDTRGLGILPALNRSQGEVLMAERPLPIAFNFIAADNERMLNIGGPAVSEEHWKTPIERLVIACADTSGPATARTATPDDAVRIAELLSASHAEEELAPEFEAAWVTTRLSRSPRDYSWRNIVLSEHAMLGVWDSGLRIVRKTASSTTAARTATALDWGYEPGAEDEMQALVRSACASLASLGVDDLLIFTSPPSRGRNPLAGLARAIEPFRVSTLGVPPCADATAGIYVDPIYF